VFIPQIKYHSILLITVDVSPTQLTIEKDNSHYDCNKHLLLLGTLEFPSREGGGEEDSWG
jgi:hypothetical protein